MSDESFVEKLKNIMREKEEVKKTLSMSKKRRNNEKKWLLLKMKRGKNTSSTFKNCKSTTYSSSFSIFFSKL
jgi:hypothetical protein